MIPNVADSVLTVFVIFCRIGACLMLMPGFSSSYIPTQVRLFLAVAVALALTPLLLGAVQPSVSAEAPGRLLSLIFSELFVGGLIGLLGRVVFLALQTLATAMAMCIGLGAIPGTPIDEAEPVMPLVPIITVSATVLMFVTDTYWEVLRGLVASYRVWPPTGGLTTQFALTLLTERLSEAFLLALRVASPFIIYAVIVNLAIGLANKLTPTVPVFFIAMPFVIAGGLFLLYLAGSELLLLFMSAFAIWLSEG